MGRRKRIKSTWPPNGWEVEYEIEVDGTKVESRKHDVLVRFGERSTDWVFFDYFVHNTNNGARWVSGFDECGFTAFRIDQILKARPHREKKKTIDDYLNDAGEGPVRTAQSTPGKKPRKKRSDAGVKRGSRKAKKS